MSDACFDAVLFDLDGTLADTAPDLVGALNRVLKEEGRMPKQTESLRTAISRGANGLIPLGFGITEGHPDFLRLKARFLAHYADAVCVQTRLFDGMQTVLERLTAGRVPWGIVTNKKRSLTVKLLDCLQPPSPDCVVCGDDASRAKPWPDTLLLAARQLKADPVRCVYIGDYHHDIEAARAANMTSIAAVYGYHEPSPPVEAWGASYQIDTPAELNGILWSEPSGSGAHGVDADGQAR